MPRTIFFKTEEQIEKELDIKESTNKRRLFTGMFGGFGSTSLYLQVLCTIRRKVRNR